MYWNKDTVSQRYDNKWLIETWDVLKSWNTSKEVIMITINRNMRCIEMLHCGRNKHAV